MCRISLGNTSKLNRNHPSKGWLRYLNEIRCQRAKLMLREGRANVSGVAQRCGFNNVSYFTKIYKEIYGHSPSNDFLGQNIKE